MFYDHNRIKLEINNKMALGKSSNILNKSDYFL